MRYFQCVCRISQFPAFLGIWLCVWNLVMQKLSGIYIELVFLDGFLNFGQGLLTFVIFGLDTKYILIPLKKWFRKLFYGRDSLILPNWEDLGKVSNYVSNYQFW